MYGKAKSIAMCVKYLFSGVSDLAFVCFKPTSFVHYAKRLEFLEIAYRKYSLSLFGFGDSERFK